METLKIVLIGKVTNIVIGEENNRIQFLTKRSNGSLEIVGVKVSKDDKFEVGDDVKILVDIGVYNNKIYYKYIGKLK